MPRPKQHVVRLSAEEQAQLSALLRKGEASARVLTRARALLLAHDNGFDKDVAAALQLNNSTVMNIRQRFTVGGLAVALYDKPRPGAAPKLDGKQEALLVDLAMAAGLSQQLWSIAELLLCPTYPARRWRSSHPTTCRMKELM